MILIPLRVLGGIVKNAVHMRVVGSFNVTSLIATLSERGLFIVLKTLAVTKYTGEMQASGVSSYHLSV